MEITTFKDMYVAELQELLSAEEQMVEALRRVGETSSNPTLKSALMQHCEQTLAQKERLTTMLGRYGADPKAHTDQAIQALIRETEKMLRLLKDGGLRDAGLIASIQKIEHYEIAAYGTAATLAGQLAFHDDQRILHDSLEEEKRMDVALSRIAKSEVNRDALAAE